MAYEYIFYIIESYLFMKFRYNENKNIYPCQIQQNTEIWDLKAGKDQRK